jgi:iron only hydrogenase large subunit-like protein/uncharacterized Fe-S cluster-containing protein
MSTYIKVRKANCKNCYKCLKNCAVKSIKYENEKVEILEDMCILCGRCITTCPQGAKKIDNDITKIKQWVADPDITTVVSLAPSYVVAFGENAKALVASLKELGFDYVEETAIGARYVSEEYIKLIESGKQENIISSSCPAVNMLVEKYYPQLIPYLAPVLSPLMVHGKLIKQERGKDTKVIVIDSCLARIKEVDDNPEYADGMLTFNQLRQWLMDKKVMPAECEVIPFDKSAGYSRIYPVVGGTIHDMLHKYKENGGKAAATERICDFDLVGVSGLRNVVNLLEEVSKGSIRHAFIEANSCYGGCSHGPFMAIRNVGYKAGITINNYADEAVEPEVVETGDISRQFTPDPVEQDIPSEETIRAILTQIGKSSRAQELNCGSCGYPTCREKAIAVYQNKAELNMCMPYMTDISQAMANVTLSVTPNYIIAVDADMHIREFNVAAQKLFGITRNEALNKRLSEFIETADFEQVITNKSSIYDKKVRYDDLGIVTEQTIVYSADRNMAIAIIKDVTAEEAELKSLMQIKLESVEMAQKVIDKQMVVAQQIASLLGETTAETKVTLNRLKNLIAKDEVQ